MADQPTLKFNYTPHAKQQEIHNACSDTSTNMWTIVCAGRQAGKSKCAKFQAIYWALKNNNVNVWYVCPSEGQAKVAFREIFLECARMGLIKSQIKSKGDIHISFYNGSKIEFKSAESQALRGNSVHYLILDECAFIKREVIEEEIQFTMNVTGRKILAISTPKGKNYFFELFMRGQSEEFSKDYKSFRFSSKDNPNANLNLIEQFKKSTTDAVYRQEIEAEFVDSAAVFSNIYELSDLQKISQPIKGHRYYMGIDIALAARGDYSVITIVNHLGQMIFMDRFRGIEAAELRGRILQVYKTFRPVISTIESNNQGLPIYQDLRNKIANLQAFTTTNSSKEEIINQLIAAFALKEIRVLDDNDVRSELEAFIFKFSQTGKIQFEAASGFHDDIVMSLAIAWDTYVKAVRTGGYMVMGSGHTGAVSKKPNVVKSYIAGLDKSDQRFNGDDGQEFIFFGR